MDILDGVRPCSWVAMNQTPDTADPSALNKCFKKNWLDKSSRHNFATQQGAAAMGGGLGCLPVLLPHMNRPLQLLLSRLQSACSDVATSFQPRLWDKHFVHSLASGTLVYSRTNILGIRQSPFAALVQRWRPCTPLPFLLARNIPHLQTCSFLPRLFSSE